MRNTTSIPYTECMLFYRKNTEINGNVGRKFEKFVKLRKYIYSLVSLTKLC